MNESDLGALLTERFPYRFPHLQIDRRNILNVETSGGWRARNGKRGQADYFVYGPRVHVEVETKAARPKWYKEQLAWRALCQRLEIPYLIARALPGEEPEATVARWLEELRVLCS